jgi:cytochrome c biogenesis protein CcmG/thiol:disulfide interchange protein DsbE
MEFVMKHRSRIALLVVIFALMNFDSDAAAKSPVVDQPAPDFQLTTFDGEKLSLADLKGQVVVLNFWATWCGPCKQELPLLEGYYRAQQRAGLRVLAIATEDSLKPYQLKPLAKILTIPMVKRFKGNYGDIKALPTNFVIDRRGVLRYAAAGGFTRETMAEILGPLIEESVQ